MAKKVLTDEEQRLVDTLQGQMKDNSAAWFDADNDTRTKLHEQNKTLSQDIDKITGGTTTFNSGTGVWNTQYNEGAVQLPEQSTTKKFYGRFAPIQEPAQNTGPVKIGRASCRERV